MIDNQASFGLAELGRNSAAANQLLGLIVEALRAITRLSTGSFTLAAAATKTVTDTNVTANCVILLVPTNASAATLMSGAKSLYISTKTAGASFAVATADGNNAAGTETFDYIIYAPL